jgi:hypothetical protein
MSPRRSTVLLARALLPALLLLAARAAHADDAGGGGSDDGGAGAPAVPLACDGALCDTTNGSGCGLGRPLGARAGAGSDLAPWALVPLLLASALRRGRRAARLGRRSWAARALPLLASLLLVAAASRPAAAEPEPAVDVVIRDPLPPPRRVVIAWNPLPLFTISKVSFDVVVVPREHHALVISPFYAWASTAPIYVFDDAGNPTQLPEQKFSGFGAELGYRYYLGRNGPRGLFVGPSLILGAFTATAQNGSQTSYVDIGGAVDVGYQLLLAERVSLSLGGGVQVAGPDHSLPAQQFPARIYANFGVLPRLLISIGVAL